MTFIGASIRDHLSCALAKGYTSLKPRRTAEVPQYFMVGNSKMTCLAECCLSSMVCCEIIMQALSLDFPQSVNLLSMDLLGK